MTNQSGEAAFSFSMKNQMDQKQPLLTIRGDSAIEFANNLTALGLDATGILQGFGSTGIAGATEQAVGNLESGGLAPSVQPQNQTPATPYPQEQPAAPVQQAAPPAPAQQTPWGAGASAATPQAPVCPHGVRTHRSGTSAKGPWAAWMCPSPKGTPDQCEPIWNRDPAYVAPA